MNDIDHPTLSLSSVKDAIVEGWHLAGDLLGRVIMGDIDLSFDVDDEEEY